MSYTIEDTKLMWMGDHPDFKQVARFEGDRSRWSLEVMEVHKHTTTGEHWAISICEALTEMQEHEIYDPPYRVEPHEIVVPATTRIDWIKVNS
jgi:hypothetical protein